MLWIVFYIAGIFILIMGKYKKIEVIRANPSGFCHGAVSVDRLMKSVEGGAMTYGDLLHNKRYIASAEARSVFSRTLHEILESDPNDVRNVIIRAHGARPDVIEKIKSKGFNILDGTCRNVHNIHELVKKYWGDGYEIFIFGKKDHPETEGIAGCAENPHLIYDISDICLDDRYGKSCLVSQTTQRQEAYDKVIEKLQKICSNLIVKNTICDATRKRQEAAKELAKDVDAMFIIGGKNSSNTKEMYNVCTSVNPQSYHIQSKHDITDSMLFDVKKAGVSAGCSTPEVDIDEVMSQIRKYVILNH